jgi:hypothetical protein
VVPGLHHAVGEPVRTELGGVRTPGVLVLVQSIDLATWIIVPRGASRPPILTSVSASRIISDAGG